MFPRAAAFCLGALTLFLGVGWVVRAQEEGAPLELTDLIQMTVERNPKLARVQFAVDAARGKALQVGLYPNPTVDVIGDEISDVTFPGGIWAAPLVTQEIVTARKLQLNRDAALKEVDQAALSVISERYNLFSSVRQDFFELLTLQRRAEILEAVVKLAESSVDTSEKLLKAKQVARLDVVQLEVDLERYKADLTATRQQIPATYRRLVSSVGVQDLPYQPVKGTLDAPLPEYDLEKLRAYVLAIHPDIRRAQLGVDANQILLTRARVEPIPNIKLQGGYTFQGQNASHDWLIGAGVTVPLFNRNQGNIQAARANIGEAIQQVGAVENDLVYRLSNAYAGYVGNRRMAERYRERIIPRANETYQLALKAYQGGQFEYLRVLEAQRAMANTRLEYIQVLGGMWQQASIISGLMLEDDWPAAPSRDTNPRSLLPNELRDGTEILPAPQPGAQPSP